MAALMASWATRARPSVTALAVKFLVTPVKKLAGVSKPVLNAITLRDIFDDSTAIIFPMQDFYCNQISQADDSFSSSGFSHKSLSNGFQNS
jgi:hypothetical protein